MGYRKLVSTKTKKAEPNDPAYEEERLEIDLLLKELLSAVSSKSN